MGTGKKRIPGIGHCQMQPSERILGGMGAEETGIPTGIFLSGPSKEKRPGILPYRNDECAS